MTDIKQTREDEKYHPQFYPSSKSTQMKKALVIFSGGQDSTTCLFYAMQNFEKVEAISFFYNQNHVVELECAQRLCKMNGIKHKVVDVSFYKDLIDSAMVSGGDTSQTLDNGLPSSFVPNRNALFITIAHAYAQKIGAQTLVTGVCQTDYSGYPDCRHVFITLIQNTLNSGSMQNIYIETPMMYLTKAETFSMADKLGRLEDVLEYSHTCYKGNRFNRHDWGYGCGVCPACMLRAKGYNEYRSTKAANMV